MIGRNALEVFLKMIEELDNPTDSDSISIPATSVFSCGVIVGFGSIGLKKVLSHFIRESGTCAVLTGLLGHPITYFQVVCCLLDGATELGFFMFMVVGLYLWDKKGQQERSKDKY